jgi:hypothetical protein
VSGKVIEWPIIPRSIPRGISPVLVMECEAIRKTERNATLMTGVQVCKRVAPGAWASYLINGDASGLADADRRACDAWIKREGIGSPVGCEDVGFYWSHDAFADFPYASDCQLYTFLTRAEPKGV